MRTKLAGEYLLVDEIEFDFDFDFDFDEDDNIGVFTLSPESELFFPPLFIFLVLDII